MKDLEKESKGLLSSITKTFLMADDYDVVLSSGIGQFIAASESVNQQNQDVTAKLLGISTENFTWSDAWEKLKEFIKMVVKAIMRAVKWITKNVASIYKRIVKFFTGLYDSINSTENRHKHLKDVLKSLKENSTVHPMDAVPTLFDYFKKFKIKNKNVNDILNFFSDNQDYFHGVYDFFHGVSGNGRPVVVTAKAVEALYPMDIIRHIRIDENDRLEGVLSSAGRDIKSRQRGVMDIKTPVEFGEVNVAQSLRRVILIKDMLIKAYNKINSNITNSRYVYFNSKEYTLIMRETDLLEREQKEMMEYFAKVEGDKRYASPKDAELHPVAKVVRIVNKSYADGYTADEFITQKLATLNEASKHNQLMVEQQQDVIDAIDEIKDMHTNMQPGVKGSQHLGNIGAINQNLVSWLTRAQRGALDIPRAVNEITLKETQKEILHYKGIAWVLKKTVVITESLVAQDGKFKKYI